VDHIADDITINNELPIDLINNSNKKIGNEDQKIS
jgi:hypothetical protein